MFGGGNTIKTADAIRAARALIGTPYATLDCIGLIVRVIRTSPGGDPTYRCQGTNWLWRSIDNSARFRDLTWRQEGIQGARAGELAFKRNGGDVHHVGIVTERGTVIHSSSVYGKVVETPLDESWQLLAVHRYIEAAGTAETEEAMGVLYQAVVNTARDPLNVRDAPEASGRKIGELARGSTVDVLAEPCEGWAYVRGDGVTGYASSAYLARVEVVSADAAQAAGEEPYTTIRRKDGTVIRLSGRWSVLED